MSSGACFVGPAVRMIREARGFTQARLAEKSGMGLKSIQHIEAGRRSVSPTSLPAIAAALDVPVTYLFLLVDDSDDAVVRRFQTVARTLLGIPEETPVG